MSVRYRNQFDSVTIIYDHCESTTNILTNIAIILSSEYKQTKVAFLITDDIDVSDKPLLVTSRCWWFDIGDIFWMLVQKANVKIWWRRKGPKPSPTTKKLSPTHFVSDICHQHQYTFDYEFINTPFVVSQAGHRDFADLMMATDLWCWWQIFDDKSAA